MKIIVTGGCGFIGYYVVKDLVNQNYTVEVWDNFSLGHRFLDTPFDNPFYIRLDISSASLGSLAIRLGDEEIIFIHLAAQSRIQPSIIDTYPTHKSNITGTYKMLELAKMVNTKNFIFAGSSSAYGETPILPNKEDMAYDVRSPYSMSKIVGEMYCKLYSSLYGLPTTILRFFNVYGARQEEEGTHATVIGVFEKCYRENKPFPVVSPGIQRRDFTHVEDITKGIVGAALGKAYAGEIFNLGSGTNYSIFDVVRMFNSPEVLMLPSRQGEYPATLADSSKALGAFGWKVTRDLASYIKEIVNRKNKIK